MMILGEMCALSLIYSYVAVCRFVQYVMSFVISVRYVLISRLMLFNTKFVCLLFCIFVFYFM